MSNLPVEIVKDFSIAQAEEILRRLSKRPDSVLRLPLRLDRPKFAARCSLNQLLITWAKQGRVREIQTYLGSGVTNEGISEQFLRMRDQGFGIIAGLLAKRIVGHGGQDLTQKCRDHLLKYLDATHNRTRSSSKRTRNLFLCDDRNITSKYNNRILYLNIFGLLAHQADYKELETNLTYGPSGPDHNVFCSVFKFCMGDAFSPWEQEQQKIREVLNLPKYKRKISTEDRASLSTRMRQLSLAVTRDRDLLFFCQTAQERPLILRDNFAFDFTAETDNRSSIRFGPSDVYFTISSVLHALRSGNSDKHALCQRVNSRCVLAPSNFDRFNDGLVQASILRAALPVELEYSIATEESRQMGEILQGIFANQDNVQGEAAAEFALALVLRRLKLQDEDIERLFAKSIKTKGLAGALLRIFRVEHD